MDTINGSTVLLAIFAPLFIATLRDRVWDKEQAKLFAAGMIVVIYTAGRWLDGSLGWPLGPDYWSGLAAAYGISQATYNFGWSSKIIDPLERFGSSRTTRKLQ